MYCSFLLTLLASLALFAAVPRRTEAAELMLLTPDNFDKTVANGTWFVQFYKLSWVRLQSSGEVPRETWGKLVADNEEQRATGLQLGLARVNCDYHRDFCEQYVTQWYPEMQVFRNGTYVETYNRPPVLHILQDYLLNLADLAAAESFEPLPPSSRQYSVEFTKSSVSTGTTDDFKQMIANGTWFVQYYLPHDQDCLIFASTWLWLAGKDLGRRAGIQMAHVDCTVHSDICRKEGVPLARYPHLNLYHDGVFVETFDKSPAPGRVYQNALAQYLLYHVKTVLASFSAAPTTTMVVSPIGEGQAMQSPLQAADAGHITPRVLAVNDRYFSQTVVTGARLTEYFLLCLCGLLLVYIWRRWIFQPIAVLPA